MNDKRKGKPFPKLNSDKAAAKFVAEADLTAYDFSGFEPMKFEFEAKSARLNMRLPERLLDRIRDIAEKKHIPYTRYIRQLLEQDVERETSKR